MKKRKFCINKYLLYVFLLALSISSFLYVVKKANDTTISKNSQAAITRKTQIKKTLQCPSDYISVSDFRSTCGDLCMKWDNSNKLIVITANTYAGITPACLSAIVGLGPTPKYNISPQTVIITPTPASSTLPTSPTPTPMRIPINSLLTDITKTPDNAFLLSLLGRINPNIISILPLDFTQRDLLYQLIVSNQISNSGGWAAVQRQAIEQGLAVGCSWCSDSRMVIARPDSLGPPTIVLNGEKLVLPAEGIVDTASIGVRPTYYQNINQSFFITHKTCPNITTGCGALAGIQSLLNADGEQYLLNHGVSQDTITNLRTLMAQGATPDPIQWSRTGAIAQAEMNAFINQTSHSVAYGVWNHATGQFEPQGVVTVEPNGIGRPVKTPVYELDLKKFPLLQGYSYYFNDPHPLIEAIVAGQAPELNVINASKKLTVRQLFGKMASQPGVIFKATTDFVPETISRTALLNSIEAERLIGDINYSIAHLEQRGNILVLIADSQQEMNILREGILSNPTIKIFTDNGGVILEIIPDQQQIGKFTSLTARKFNSQIFTTNITTEFINLVKANRLGSLLSESQLARLASFYSVIKPFMPLFTAAIRMTGDYFTIRDISLYLDQEILGHSMVYKLDTLGERIPSYSSIYDEDDYESTYNISGGGNPYIILGKITKVKIPHDSLVDRYLEALNAWFDHGFTAPASEKFSPWKEIESRDGIFKSLILFIHTDANKDHIAKLYTPLLIKPALKDDGRSVDIDYRNPLWFNGPYNRGKNEMMLIDQTTGLFTSLRDGDGPIQFMATDEKGYQYSMEARPNRTGKYFELLFLPRQMCTSLN